MCGWVVVVWGGLQLLPARRGPESVLAEVFAQLKHHLLRHITEGCEQQSENTESMNGRCKTTANIFNVCLSKAQTQLTLKLSTGPLGVSVPLLTASGVETDTLLLLYQCYSVTTGHRTSTLQTL